MLRLKKLLVYSCRQTWEADSTQLSQYDLTCLVQELWQHKASLEQLKAHLYRLASTLSKPTDYILVADTLIHYLEPLYTETTETQTDKGWQVHTAVAQQLEQVADPLRVKKLLYAACRRTWENNPTVLTQTPLVNLVQELYRLTSTPQELDTLLHSVVSTLNRQAEYCQIAQKIAIACLPLYPSHSQSTQLLSAVTPATTSVPAATLVSAPGLALTLPTVPLSPSHLFDLRLEVMKYANPLRVKVLLFSILYGCVDYTPATWDRLKTIGLDDLLSQLMRRYPSLADLQTQLPSTACLLPERDTYAHIAAVILRAVKPCYVNRKAIASQDSLSTAEGTQAASPTVIDPARHPDHWPSEATGIQVPTAADPRVDTSS